jgi:tetratricopeptide (TPR) repeat protein
MKKYGVLLMLSFLVYLHADAQEVNKVLNEGNEFYKQQQYDKADVSYKRALELDQSNTTAKYNRAGTMVHQNRQTEAMKEYDELASTTTDADLKSKSYYNKGVVLSAQKRLEESIEAYKNALRQNPNDQEARENLQKAMAELKKKTPPPPPKKDNKKKNEKQQKKQQQQKKMNENEAQQRLKLLEQKEKELQERLQKQKNTTGGGQTKDW